MIKKVAYITLIFIFTISFAHAARISPRELLATGNMAGKCEIIETMFYLRHRHFQDKKIDDFLTVYMNAFLKENNLTPEEHQRLCKESFKTYKELWKIFDPKEFESNSIGPEIEKNDPD